MVNIRKMGLFTLLLTLFGSLFQLTESHAASSNSIAWYPTSSQLKSSNLNDIVVSDRQIYVTVGDEGTILTSSDARTWRSAKFAGTDQLTSIATNGETFVAVGGTVISSKNGVDWTKGKWSKEYTIGELISPVYKKTIDKSFTVDWKTKLSFSALNYRSILWDGKRYVALVYWSMETGKPKKNSEFSSSKAPLSGMFAMTSADGLQWEVKGTELGGDKLLFTGTQYVAMGRNSVYISKNLTQWKEYYPDAFQKRTTSDFRDVIYRNGMYIAIHWDAGVFDNGQTGVIYTSSDGIKWKELTSSLYGQKLKTILWDGTQYWIGGEHGMLLRSANGTTWEQWKTGLADLWDDKEFAGENAAINKIIYDGKRYVIAGNRGTIIVSDKLFNAEVIRQRIGEDYRYMDYDGKKRYVAAGKMGAIIESQNGYDWVSADMGDFADPDFYWSGVAAGNGVALALGRNETGFAYIGPERYMYSPRPGAWEWKEFPIKVKGPDGVEFRNGKFYVYVDNGYIASSDGINWSKLTKLKPPMEKVVTNGTINLGISASTTDATGTYKSSGDLYSSKDGNKWNKVTLKHNNKIVSFYVEDLLWSGKQFTAIGGVWPDKGGYADPAVLWSADGSTWKYKATGTTLESIACNGQACVAANRDGALYTSESDMNFKASTKPTRLPIIKVLWDGEKFIAMGKSGTILVSKKPTGTGAIAADTVVPFTIKVDEEAILEEQRRRDEEAAAFQAEAERRADIVQRIGIENEYGPWVDKQYDEWLVSLSYTESIQYVYSRSGEVRNTLKFAVFFNGIDRKQLKTASEIIAAHTGASKDEVNLALQTIVNGNAAANGETQADGVLMKYNLTVQQGQYSVYADFEIRY